MSEFVLNKPTGKRAIYDAFDDFAKGYVEAMFFTNCDSGEERENLANELGMDRLTLLSFVAIERDCDAFQARAALLLGRAYQRDGYGPGQAGRDFWFTRQGHGTGFWDRKQLTADGLGDALSDVAWSFREATTSISAGWIDHD